MQGSTLDNALGKDSPGMDPGLDTPLYDGTFWLSQPNFTPLDDGLLGTRFDEERSEKR
jgi:hypothetical protein